MIQHLNTVLKKGYHCDVNKVPDDAAGEQNQAYTLKDAISYALEVKKSSIRSTSYPSYKSTVKLFQKWARYSRLSELDVTYFDKLRALYFDDY